MSGGYNLALDLFESRFSFEKKIKENNKRKWKHEDTKKLYKGDWNMGLSDVLIKLLICDQ